MRLLNSGVRFMVVGLSVFCQCVCWSENLSYPPEPEWGNLEDLAIVPCPKHISLSDKPIPIVGALRILIVPDSKGLLNTGAEEIATKLVELGGTAPEVSAIKSVDVTTLSSELSVIVGFGKDSLPFKDICTTYKGVNALNEEQGYVISRKSDGVANTIVVWGTDPLGAFYGCVTLVHLLSKGEVGMVLRPAEVVDWPDFKRRCASGIESAGQVIKKGEHDAGCKLLKYGIRRAAILKCNAVEAHFYHPEGECEYFTENELKALEEVKEFASRYGVKFRVLFSTNVGSQKKRQNDPRFKDVALLRGFFMCWSRDDLIDESCARLKEQVQCLGEVADYAFHYPDINEGGWFARCEKCKKRWGDDRAAADAYFATKLYNAIKEVSPKSMVELIYYPYGGNLSYNGNAKLREYFHKVATLTPLDAAIASREASKDAFDSWRKNIKQPLAIWWSPGTFWCGQAFAPDIAFLKSAYFGNKLDLVCDCLTAGSRHILIPSQYSFAEYVWNVNAPGAGVWKADPSVNPDIPSTGVPGDTVRDIRLAPDGENFSKWRYLKGSQEPRPMMFDLLERICVLVYGKAVAPAMAEAFRNSCPSYDIYWSQEPDVASAQANAARKAFDALLPLANKPELFPEPPEKQALKLESNLSIYKQMLKTYADLQSIMKLHAGKVAADDLVNQARKAENDDKLRIRKATEARDLSKLILSQIDTEKVKLKELYDKYGLEGVPWFWILSKRPSKYAETASRLDVFKGGFEFTINEASELLEAPLPLARKANIFAKRVKGALKIDGDSSDWCLSCPFAIDYKSYPRHVKDRSLKDNSDLATIFYVAWDDDNLYILAKVVDDDTEFIKESSFYDGDAIELWIGGAHCSMSKNKEGKDVVEAYSGMSTDGVKVAVSKCASLTLKRDFELLGRKFPDMDGKPGYVLEASIPLAPHKINAKIGERFWLAIGANDFDKDGNHAQIFFPATYAHLVLGGGKLTDFADTLLFEENPVELKMLGAKREDRTAQEGTDAFVKCKLRLSSPIALSGLGIQVIRIFPDGHRATPIEVKGVPSTIKEGELWASPELELNVGPAMPAIKLILRLTSDELSFETEALEI